MNAYAFLFGLYNIYILLQKRRSARNTERKKYTDDIELHLSDDETIEMDFNQNNKDGKLVQTVAVRIFFIS